MNHYKLFIGTFLCYIEIQAFDTGEAIAIAQQKIKMGYNVTRIRTESGHEIRLTESGEVIRTGVSVLGGVA